MQSQSKWLLSCCLWLMFTDAKSNGTSLIWCTRGCILRSYLEKIKQLLSRLIVLFVGKLSLKRSVNNYGNDLVIMVSETNWALAWHDNTSILTFALQCQSTACKQLASKGVAIYLWWQVVIWLAPFFLTFAYLKWSSLSSSVIVYYLRFHFNIVF